VETIASAADVGHISGPQEIQSNARRGVRDGQPCTVIVILLRAIVAHTGASSVSSYPTKYETYGSLYAVELPSHVRQTGTIKMTIRSSGAVLHDIRIGRPIMYY
jgi:hypothetical protein